MNFLEAAENLEGEDDLEILEEPPSKVSAPMAPPEKRKGSSIALNKRKARSSVVGTEKLMAGGKEMGKRQEAE